MKEQLTEEEWRQAMNKAIERFARDESLKPLVKKYQDYVRRMLKVKDQIEHRKSIIAMEEVNKTIASRS